MVVEFALRLTQGGILDLSSYRKETRAFASVKERKYA